MFSPTQTRFDEQAQQTQGDNPAQPDMPTTSTLLFGFLISVLALFSVSRASSPPGEEDTYRARRGPVDFRGRRAECTLLCGSATATSCNQLESAGWGRAGKASACTLGRLDDARTREMGGYDGQLMRPPYIETVLNVHTLAAISGSVSTLAVPAA